MTRGASMYENRRFSELVWDNPLANVCVDHSSETVERLSKRVIQWSFTPMILPTGAAPLKSGLITPDGISISL